MNRIFLWTFFLLVCSAASPFPDQKDMREAQVKAVFIYNFTQFIDWPSWVFENEDDPLVITILGDKMLADLLSKAVKTESKDNHSITVKLINHMDELPPCQILYISTTKQKELPESGAGVFKEGLLTVSNIPNFALQGGIVGFYLEENKLRIQINLDRAKSYGLTISSKLLKVADVIQKENN